jgi:hypothetical protein
MEEQNLENDDDFDSIFITQEPSQNKETSESVDLLNKSLDFFDANSEIQFDSLVDHEKKVKEISKLKQTTITKTFKPVVLNLSDNEEEM